MFATVPRVQDPSRYVEASERTVDWSDAAGLDGVLHFTGAGAVLDPFVGAALTCSRSPRLIPFVAVNPAYQHPVTAARAVSSLAQIHQRPVAVNLITGTSLPELAQYGLSVDHDERYLRLEEYTRIMTALLAGTRPVTLPGKYFRVENLQLLPALPDHLQPWLYLAGASPAAGRTAARLGAQGLGMLPPVLTGPLPPALHFGLVVRPDREQAWAAARAAWPPDAEGRAVTAMATAGGDSVWKQRLLAAAGTPATLDGYWLDPFLDGAADCPYVVGDHQDVAALFSALAAAGVSTVVLDVPMTDEDHTEMATAMALIRGARV